MSVVDLSYPHACNAQRRDPSNEPLTTFTTNLRQLFESRLAKDSLSSLEVL